MMPKAASKEARSDSIVGACGALEIRVLRRSFSCTARGEFAALIRKDLRSTIGANGPIRDAVTNGPDSVVLMLPWYAYRFYTAGAFHVQVFDIKGLP